MNFKKIAPIMILIIMMGTLIVLQPASAATSRVALYDAAGYEVSSFAADNNDKYGLEIYARLYVDGEWKAWRYLDFDVYDPKGEHLFHIKRLTSFIWKGTGIGIWKNQLSKWKTGDYTVKVSYGGNEDKGWPATSTTAVIHYNEY